MIFWVWLGSAAAALAGLYLFLIAPGKCRRDAFVGQAGIRYFAHRGLHDEKSPENSLSAFRKAAQRGYGIELDVHATRDGALVIAHDDLLQRMCASGKRISQSSLDEIRGLRLLGSQEGIPTLREALEAVSPWRPPLIVELKSDAASRRKLPEMVWREMRGYSGFWCVESFDPRQVRWFKKHARQVIRGQLAYDPSKAGERGKPLMYHLGAYLVTCFLSRPDFVAYRHDTDRNLSFRIIRFLFRPALAAWTVQNPKDAEKLESRYHVLIFEGFEPGCFSTQNKKE